jgi:hypothetical protein
MPAMTAQTIWRTEVRNAEPGTTQQKQPQAREQRAAKEITTMRKLRRLPWRIPKGHHSQPNAGAPEACSRADAEAQAEMRREAYRESLTAQPVAFAGGRYVYGDTPRVASCPTEIRRKTRHRTILPFPVAG